MLLFAVSIPLSLADSLRYSVRQAIIATMAGFRRVLSVILPQFLSILALILALIVSYPGRLVGREVDARYLALVSFMSLTKHAAAKFPSRLTPLKSLFEWDQTNTGACLILTTTHGTKSFSPSMRIATAAAP